MLCCRYNQDPALAECTHASSPICSSRFCLHLNVLCRAPISGGGGSARIWSPTLLRRKRLQQRAASCSIANKPWAFCGVRCTFAEQTFLQRIVGLRLCLAVRFPKHARRRRRTGAGRGGIAATRNDAQAADGRLVASVTRLQLQLAWQFGVVHGSSAPDLSGGFCHTGRVAAGCRRHRSQHGQAG